MEVCDRHMKHLREASTTEVKRALEIVHRCGKRSGKGAIIQSVMTTVRDSLKNPLESKNELAKTLCILCVKELLDLEAGLARDEQIKKEVFGDDDF